MADLITELRVVSVNCWGLKYISKLRRERLAEIGNQLAQAKPSPDLVGLQECWTQADFETICQRTRHILPFNKFYFSGVFGSGLAILSRWPIIESSMYQYPLNGRPTAFYRGDWFVGKGVARAVIRASSGDILEAFCTHLHAPYEKEPNDSYLCHRTAQAWEIAKLMKTASERGRVVIVMGDFNMVPKSLAYRIIEAHGAVEDVWRVVHPESSLEAAEDAAQHDRHKPVPTARYNVDVNGVTCDSVLNTWRWNKGHQQKIARGQDVIVPDDTLDPCGKRLDYVFLGQPQGPSERCWAVESVAVGLTERHPTLLCSLSDHFSIEATLAVGRHVARKRINFADSHTYDDILKMIDVYESRELRQRKLRLYHFIITLIVAIGCLVAVWFSPANYVSFILMVVSTIWLMVGAIDGLIGGLFMTSELRTLKEFRWEIANAKTIAAGLHASS